ncbi:MAG: DUF1028 domain-containing protein [Tepidiformaceae bacterium]
MTYSIAARDPETGDIGVGVQTHQPAVGAIVPWVDPLVGAVATQANVNPRFGAQGLALMKSGLDAARALQGILATDAGAGRRQVALLPCAGPPAVHTGDQCIPFASHLIGEHYSVQANMMLTETVPAAMAAAFESATGHLASRILAALEAAQAEGGDIRGSQSAAILVRRPGRFDYTWDLRADNDPNPNARLRELVNIRLADQLIERAVANEPGAQSLAMAFESANALAASGEQTFWFALSGLNTALRDVDGAAQLLEPLFARAPQWRELLHRLDQPELAALKLRFPR